MANRIMMIYIKQVIGFEMRVPLRTNQTLKKKSSLISTNLIKTQRLSELK